MVEQTPPTRTVRLQLPRQMPAGEVIAVNVTDQEYMAQYAAHFCEWVDGVVIKMPPASLTHDDLTGVLREFLRAYLALRPIGQVRAAPIVMRLPGSRREPDLQVILGENQRNLRETLMDGPADIAIEVASPANYNVDYGDKYREYQEGGVREYWLIDPMQRAAHFHRLQGGVYVKQAVDSEQRYRTPLLPDFALPVPRLFAPPVPNFYEVGEMVRAMLR